jgi:hypothetical protein
MLKQFKRSLLAPIVLCAAIFFCYPVASQERVQIDLMREIRAHRIAQISDAEIRKLSDTAEVMRQKEESELQEERSQSSRRRIETLEKCKDVVFQMREERLCNAARGPFWSLNTNIPGPRSKEAIFDALILGHCNFISGNRQKLVEAKCLPPR